MKTKSTLMVLLCCCLLSACSATRGYEGPERAATELARVYFYTDKPVDLTQMAVDGKNQGFFDMGLDVLPGEHQAWMEYEVKNEECDAFGCGTKTYTGRCEASLRTEAGKTYSIRASGSGDAVFVSVEEKGSGALAGSGSCHAADFNFSYKPQKPR